MMRAKIHTLFIALLTILSCVLMFPRESVAERILGDSNGPFFNIDAGYEMMITDSDIYDDLHHGFAGSLTLGYNFLIFSVSIKQDLGFIDVHSSIGDEKLFKGATFLAGGVMLPFSSKAFVHTKFGLGATYMKAPSFADSDMEAGFAIQPSLELLFPKAHLGLAIDYTLVCTDSEVFDSNLTHFVAFKAKIIFGSYDL